MNPENLPLQGHRTVLSNKSEFTEQFPSQHHNIFEFLYRGVHEFQKQSSGPDVNAIYYGPLERREYLLNRIVSHLDDSSLLKLTGKRLVITPETGHDCRINAEAIKQLTGVDPMKTRMPSGA